MKKILIFLNGEWLPSKGILTIPEGNTPPSQLFIADGGYRHAKHFESLPSHVEWWGDFDSTPPEALKEFAWERHEIPREKNLSDFAAILDRIQTLFTEPLFIEIWGAIGGQRSDHERINLEEIKAFLANREGVVLCHPNLAFFRQTPVILDLPKETPFSVWSVLGQGHLRYKGCRYEGDVHLERPSHGLSNIAEESLVKLTPLDSNVYVVNWTEV